MPYNYDNPLIVQGDSTILVEVNNKFYEDVREYILGQKSQ